MLIDENHVRNECSEDTAEDKSGPFQRRTLLVTLLETLPWWTSHSPRSLEHRSTARTFSSLPGALSAFRLSISCCSRAISSFKSNTNIYKIWTG